jgi:hypothetical protein
VTEPTVVAKVGQEMSMLTRRQAIVTLAFLLPSGRALKALQKKASKPATVTLIVDGMT